MGLFVASSPTQAPSLCLRILSGVRTEERPFLPGLPQPAVRAQRLPGADQDDNLLLSTRPDRPSSTVRCPPRLQGGLLLWLRRGHFHLGCGKASSGRHLRQGPPGQGCKRGHCPGERHVSLIRHARHGLSCVAFSIAPGRFVCSYVQSVRPAISMDISGYLPFS